MTKTSPPYFRRAPPGFICWQWFSYDSMNLVDCEQAIAATRAVFLEFVYRPNFAYRIARVPRSESDERHVQVIEFEDEKSLDLFIETENRGPGPKWSKLINP